MSAIKDRADLAEMFATDMDSPIVTVGVVLLTLGILSGLHGTVRTDGPAFAGRMHAATTDSTRSEEIAAHHKAAVDAGLPGPEWTGLEASTYRRLRVMDAETVAFWMGSDVQAVLRWQAGRSLADDTQDGMMVPVSHDEGDWVVPAARRLPVPDADGTTMTVA